MSEARRELVFASLPRLGSGMGTPCSPLLLPRPGEVEGKGSGRITMLGTFLCNL